MRQIDKILFTVTPNSIVLKNYLSSIFFSFGFIILSSFQSTVFSQNTIQQDTIEVDSTEAVRLGLFNKKNRNTFKILFSGKPAKAGLFSLLLPGAGQAYNKKYWYVPIVWAGLGWFGYKAIMSTNEFRKAKSVYNCLIKHGDGSCTYVNSNNEVYSQATLLRPEYDNLKLAKERNWVTFGIVYFVQVIHAYIQRHLVDFDLNEDLSLTPSFHNGTPALGLSLNLNSKNKK